MVEILTFQNEVMRLFGISVIFQKYRFPFLRPLPHYDPFSQVTPFMKVSNTCPPIAEVVIFKMPDPLPNAAKWRKRVRNQIAAELSHF